MNSEVVLWVFAIAIVALSVWCFVLLTWGTKKQPIGKDEWYELKFKRLLEMFFAGLMFFSIIMSFLALLPRYDYESVNQKYQTLQEKTAQLEEMQQKITIQQEQIKRQYIVLENAVAAIYNESINPQINKSMDKIQKQFRDVQGQIIALRDEIKKGKSAAEAQEVDRLIPDIAVPKIEVPKVEVPKVEVPKVEVPKVEVPRI